MKAGAAPVFILAACLLFSPSFRSHAQNGSGATEGFRTEGSVHLSIFSGSASSAAEAEEKARGAALRGLFEGLGKDRLFAEVFTASPPISLSFELLASVKEGGSYKATVALRVDDESLRIIERGPYLAAATSLLDKTEAASDEAESRRTAAGEAEAAADLGAALGQYGMAVDACLSALELIDPVGDPSIFSSVGKRTSPELKKSLSALLAESKAGIERVKSAQAALAADASTEAVGQIADDAIAAADRSDALLSGERAALGSLGSCDSERLLALRDRIEAQRRALADAKAALDRALASRDKARAGFADDKLDYASRRLATADSSLAAAYRSVDREIRDPSARRAARAAAWRWALLHEPREYASLRAYLPFAIGMEEKSLEASPFEARLGLEGAFAFGSSPKSGGVWLRTRADYSVVDLAPDVETAGDEQVFTQLFDFGFWGKGLFFGGYRWDWSRRVDGQSLPNSGVVELGLGGVYPHGSGSERFSRADWLAALSYQLPYKDPALEVSQSSRLYNALNAGLETQFRLGKIGLFEASVSERLAKRSAASLASDYASILSWAIGLGIRLPYPFALGAEYSGDYVRPLLDSGILGSAARDESGRFRFYLQYSL